MASNKKGGSKRREHDATMRAQEIRARVSGDYRELGRPLNRAERRSKPGRPLRAHHGYGVWVPRPNATTRPVVPLGEDGESGYYADPVRWDDCFRSAIATATQVPPEQIPDPRLQQRVRAGEDPDEISDESWERIARWAERRGWQLVLHDTVPVDRERWIGVCVDDGRGTDPNPFPDHCLVMSYGDIIFDVAGRASAPPGQRLRTWRPSDVTYGVSFDPTKRGA